MNQRQEKLFLNIVREHIDSARAVGSRFLVDKYNLDVSSATIRNDMAELENSGLITHLHISAGRIPTEKGYKHYIENYLDSQKELRQRDKEALEKIKKEGQSFDNDLMVKNLAKEIAGLTNLAAVIAFAKNNVYYTGISNLFCQPEFADFDLIYNMSEVIDHLDDVVADIFESIKDTQIKVGKDNYFANNCGTVLTRVGDKLVGLLGPIRMDYERNLGLINYAKKLLTN